METTNEELQATNEELETTNEELQATNEELETTNEELQATNEELETTNEELQATNEELETTNEELQATNQELETTNQEVNRRTEETSQVNAFLEAVLSSLRSGVVVVDWERRVMGWNDVSEDLWGLRADEVRGERLEALDIGLPFQHIEEPIRACLEEEAASQEVVVEATSRRGKSLRCRVVCSPLLADGARRLGVILLVEPGEGEWSGGS